MGYGMGTDYDAIAADYRRAKQQPWRLAIESYTLMGLVGDLERRSAVDVACGEGFYTRLLRRHGAARVVGVDVSEGMIRLAREAEEVAPLGVEYRVGDALRLDLPETFDLAVAAYLLNYARDADELAAMCRGVARCLRPGGRFVAVNSNPGMDYRRLPSFRRYGFDVHLSGEVRDGTPFTWTFYLDGGPVRVENYHLGVATHEAALRSVGFHDVTWHRPRLAPDAAADGDWSSFLEHPPVVFLECRT